MPRTYLSVRFQIPDAEGRPQALGSIAVDITARKQAEHLTRQLAFFDPLTGLPNRRLLLDRLRQALATSARRGRHGAVFFVDLDHFKTLNDTLGHDQGDLLLIEVGRRLLSCVRSEDTAARLGGDEFVVMAVNLAEDPHTAAEQAAQLGRKMLASVSQPFALGGESRRVTPSIGVGLFRDIEPSPEAVLKRADLAMYQAKAAGRGRLRFFDPEMQAALDARASLHQDLQRALVEGEFGLHFQGQMDLEQGLVSAEALLRWNHPTRGLLTPEHFVPLAEQTGLIGPIGAWVVEAACAQLQAWQRQPEFRHLKLAVNISAGQFQQADFAARVERALEVHGVAPQRLRLELRECPAPGHTDEAVARMHALKGRGVEFSIEDFGTGESSLAQLRHLPLDQIKIAQVLVSHMKSGSGHAAMVKTIIGVGRELGLSVLAAGVESAEQREALRAMGCRLWQGFYWGGPMPLEEFERLGRH